MDSRANVQDDLSLRDTYLQPWSSSTFPIISSVLLISVVSIMDTAVMVWILQKRLTIFKPDETSAETTLSHGRALHTSRQKRTTFNSRLERVTWQLKSTS